MNNNYFEWFSSPELGEKFCRVRIPGRPELYVFPKEMTNTYALTAFKYGSNDSCFRVSGNGDFRTVPDGVAHFLEHKMFTAEDGSDAFDHFAALGADANAYTSFDRTVYLFNCTERFDEAYRELLSMVTHPYFTDETVKKEQGIIAQEIRMYDDDPDDICFQNLLSALYFKHPVRINVGGTVDSIARITPQTLYDCHKSFYSHSNMVTVICGRVDPQSAAELLEGALPYADPVKIERRSVDEPSDVYKKRIEARRQASKPLFGIGFKDTDISSDPAEQHKKHIALSILLRMIFASSGELYNELYDAGMITSPLSYSHDYGENYSFVSIMGAAENPDAVYDKVMNHISRLMEKGIDARDFERCRRVKLSDTISRYDSTEDLANSLISYAFGDLNIFDDSRVISQLSIDYVQALLSKIFTENKTSFSVVYPL